MALLVSRTGLRCVESIKLAIQKQPPNDIVKRERRDNGNNNKEHCLWRFRPNVQPVTSHAMLLTD